MEPTKDIIAGDGKIHLLKKQGTTEDIIASIREADKLGAEYVKDFAVSLAGADIFETCANLYNFLHTQVEFIEDRDGVQYVQSPGQVYQNRKVELGGTGKGADCKSFSLFCSSVLKSLGYTDFKYRFISEKANEDLHHVYLIVNYNGTYIPLDVTLDEFCTEVKFEKKLDLPPSRSASIGAARATLAVVDSERKRRAKNFDGPIGSFKIGSCMPIGVGATVAEADFDTWEAFENAFANGVGGEANRNLQAIAGLTNSMKGSDVWHNKNAKMWEAIHMVENDWYNLCKYSTCMLVHFWDANEAILPVGSNSIYFGYNMYEKINTAKDYYDTLIGLGCSVESIHQLVRVACFNTYGITADYMLYKCYCMVNYGQPFKPQPGVPYFDTRTGTFTANGGDANTAYLISLCFPVGGGLGRPFGEPYWCAGGYVMGNGATGEEVAVFELLNDKPTTGIANNGAGVTEAVMLQAQDEYNKWRKGELVVLPVPNAGGVPGIHGCEPPRIGILPIAEILAIIAAVVAACVAIIGAIIKIIQATKKQPDENTVMIPQRDFLKEYRTVDGCYIGTVTQGPNAGHTAKMCNGVIVDNNPDMNNPANQPGGVAGGGSGGPGFLDNPTNQKMLAGGLVLAGAALLLSSGDGGSKKVNGPEEKEDNARYKVYRVFKKSRRKEVIERNLTEAQARRLVQSYPNSNTSMVVYTKMNGDRGELRAVKVTYSNGDTITTSMAAHLTDAEIKNYFRVGREFNLGRGEEDLMAKVKKVEILK